MKALVFPKDQEMFPEIDENGLLRSSGGTDSIARAYEATIEAYTGAHTKAADVTYEKNKDHFERAGISKEKFVRSEDSRKQFLQDLWHKLDKLVEDKSKDSIVRFPKTSYAVHLEKNYYIDHFKNLKDSLNNYNEGWNLGGLVGECFNDTEKKARELQEARKKRKKLWLELPIIALQIIAAVIVLVFGIRITSGSIDS
ncbi:MAG TPA: hypothetical protein IAA21_01600, partial [Candidatus Blautia faecigallinarum]|nr:hypothetical protein [Candidatus Blautia faecigallinarum]